MTPILSPAELAEIEGRCARATKGPWRACGKGDPPKQLCVCGGVWSLAIDAIVACALNNLHHEDMTGGEGLNESDETRANADFIAHAREDVERMALAIRALEARLGELEGGKP